MSAQFAVVPARAVLDRELPRGALLVLMAVSLHADREGWCWPSQSRLAELTGMSQQAVSKYLSELRKAGYLRRVETRRDDGGRGTDRLQVVYDSPRPPTTSEVVAPTTSEVVAPTTSEVVAERTKRTISPSLRSGEDGTTKGSRLPAGWAPQAKDWEWGLELMPAGELIEGTDAFRDYWAAQPGQRGVKLDWSATWRNWIRREAKDAARRRPREKLSAVERAHRATDEWERDQGRRRVVAAHGEPVRAQVDRAVRQLAGRAVDDSADDVGF